MNKQPSLKKSFHITQAIIPKDLLTKNINNSPLCHANFYMLVLSTLIICIGLDERSNTIIIGGMVITPLLGSLLSLAYSMAAKDKAMIWHTVFNYLGCVLIGIAVSTLYFAIVPSSSVTHEMLKLIDLSYHDIVISIIGGITLTLGFFYGQPLMPYIGASIATTLAPPVCLIGYGISQFHLALLLAALRMFIVNSVLIFLSCLLLFYMRQKMHT